MIKKIFVLLFILFTLNLCFTQTQTEEKTPATEKSAGSQENQNSGNNISESGNQPAQSAASENEHKSDGSEEKKTDESKPEEKTDKEANSQTMPPNDSSQQNTSVPQPPVQSGQMQQNPSGQEKIRNAKIIHKFKGGISEIVNSGNLPVFFAAGNDGFVTKYSYPDFTPDTWQLSKLPIKKIAVHPQGKLVAIYESDGFSVHQISLWDWSLKKTVFAKRLSDSVVSLSWSAKGSYLFVGNRSIEGITVLDSKGNIQKIYSQAPGIVFLAATAESERSIVTYGESGRLVYTEISGKKKLKEFRTENKLENPNLIKNFNQVIGYKNNKVYVINAITGDIVEQYNANYAVFAAKIQDIRPIWIERTKRKNEWCIRQGNTASQGFYLPSYSKITAARHIENHVIVGTDDGEIYMLSLNVDSSVKVETPIDYSISEVEDITGTGNILYILSSGKIYKTESPDSETEILAEDINASHFKFFKDGFLLWSEIKKNSPIYYYSIQNKKITVAARPKETIISLSTYNDLILYVESFNGVSVVDFNSEKKIFSYNAPGVQNAIQIDDQNMIISKSAIDKSQSPVFIINTQTQETVPITIDGELAFSLEQNSKIKNSLNCFLVNSKPFNKTELLTIDLKPEDLINSTFKAILSYKEEDLEAFLCASGNDILTNLGKNSLVHYNNLTHNAHRLKRPYSLPEKAIILDDYFVTLNYGNSISWYNKKDGKLITTKTLTEELPE